LRAKEEYLQTANEELETSNEELKSSNEEMQSVNEELQSTNEELETSKEELQSVNEELATVNSELQTKVADLSRANNDMNNLLAGTGIGTFFVDHQLRILRFTPAATRIINVILSDVGRPVNHILSNLAGYDRLAVDVQAVLDTLAPKEVEVQTQAGEWYSMRITPYRTLDNVIEGAVITFVDISRAKKAQEALRESESHFRQLAESLPQPVWICLPDGRCDYLSRQWIEFTGVPHAQQLDFGWLAQVHPDDRDAVMAAWKAAVAAGEPFQVEFRVRHHSGDYHVFDLRATALRDSAGKIAKWFGTNTDITDRELQDRAETGAEGTPPGNAAGTQ
jgi:two-component system CheB/CheR fusion protein